MKQSFVVYVKTIEITAVLLPVVFMLTSALFNSRSPSDERSNSYSSFWYSDLNERIKFLSECEIFPSSFGEVFSIFLKAQLMGKGL